MNTHHKIWRVAGPMILANLSVPLLGLVDAAILGHLDSARFLAAVAVGGSILSMLYWGFGFLRMGTTGASAQAWGADSPAQQAQVLVQSALLALALATGILLLAPLILEPALALMNTPAQSQGHALSYLQIRLFSAPAVLFTYVASGWLIGQQKTYWALAISVTTNALNIVLDYLLILGAGLNSDGAAIASVISEYCGAGVALFALWPALRRFEVPELIRIATRWSDYRRLLQSNGALFIRTTALLGSLAFFTAQGAEFGAATLAGNALLLQLMFFTAHGLDGFAHAAEALAGEAIGRRSREDFIQACRACAQWTAATGLLLTLTLFASQFWIVPLLTDLPEVAREANTYFFWLALLPLVSATSYLLDGIFIGTLQTRWMQHTMLLCVFGVYLPAWYLGQTWGNHGLWLAFMCLNAARGLSLAVVFYLIDRRRGW